jgi:hypothetical protein
MHQPECVICGQPATIHETALTRGQAISRHLCQSHGQSLLPTIAPGDQAAALRSLAEQYRSLSDAERTQLALSYRLTRRARHRTFFEVADEP